MHSVTINAQKNDEIIDEIIDEIKIKILLIFIFIHYDINNYAINFNFLLSTSSFMSCRVEGQIISSIIKNCYVFKHFKYYFLCDYYWIIG